MADIEADPAELLAGAARLAAVAGELADAATEARLADVDRWGGDALLADLATDIGALAQIGADLRSRATALHRVEAELVGRMGAIRGTLG